MQILGLFGMYFDAVVVKVKIFLLLFRLALDILCKCPKYVITGEKVLLDRAAVTILAL